MIARQTADHAHKRAGNGEVHLHHRNCNGSHTRWVIGVVSAALVGMLGWFSIENYRLMQGRVDENKTSFQVISTTVQAHDRSLAIVEANQKHMMETQKRIEDKLDILLRRTK